MNSKELFHEIGSIDEGLIDEALEVHRCKTDCYTSLSRYQRHGHGKDSLRLRRKAGFIAAASILALVLVMTVYPGSMTALASRICNYISGIIKTRRV